MILLDNGSYCTEVLPEYVKIGNFSSIATGVRFHAYSDNHLCAIDPKCVYTSNWEQAKGNGEILIGSDVWICEDVRILPNIKIGNGVIIGAGAVVTKDIPDFAVVYGNPGAIHHYRFTKDQRDRLIKLNWWDWEISLVMQRREEMKDIESFLTKYE